MSIESIKMINGTDKELMFWYESKLGNYFLTNIAGRHAKSMLWAANAVIAFISAWILYNYNDGFIISFVGFFFGACALFTTIPAYELNEKIISKSWSGISSPVDDPKSVAARRLHARNLTAC